jgi:hypothetical protein
MLGQHRATLQIIQYNVWKSAAKVMIDFMADKEIREMDILAIQEPWRNPYNGQGYNPRGGPFSLIDKGTKGTRASIYINKRIPQEHIHVTCVEEDLVTIRLKVGDTKDNQYLTIHSAYSPPPESHSITQIPVSLERVIKAIEIPGDQILLGDFNLHHP